MSFADFQSSSTDLLVESRRELPIQNSTESLDHQTTHKICKSHALVDQLSHRLSPLGFECHPFLVEWYNAVVSPVYRLPFDGATLACVVLSTPDMFERVFVPWLRNNYSQYVCQDGVFKSHLVRDPLDSCMREVIGEAASLVQPSCTVLHDFDTASRLSANCATGCKPAASSCRRPAVLMQPAAHVANAARYYCHSDAGNVARGDCRLSASSASATRRVFGVCVHPVYGGWFAIRAVVIFEAFAPDLSRKQPLDILSSPEQVGLLLSLFNDNWKDWRYRDVLDAGSAPFPSHLRYSPLQRSYFETNPARRAEIIRRIISSDVDRSPPSKV